MTGPLASERLRRLVTERSRADQAGVTLESVPVEEAAPPGAAEVTGRVEQAARHMAERQDVDDRDFRRALDLWLRTTDRAARRLDNNPHAPLPPDEVYALEAVVRADGTRPSLLVRNATVDPAAAGRRLDRAAHRRGRRADQGDRRDRSSRARPPERQ